MMQQSSDTAVRFWI